MNDEVFLGEEIEKKSSKKKIFIIIICIIIVLFLFREGYKFYEFYTASATMDSIYDNLIHNTNQPRKFLLTGEEYNKSKIPDGSKTYYEYKSSYNKMVDSLINGRKDYSTYQMAVDISCKDGTIYKNVGVSEDIKCPDYPNDFGQRTPVGVKEISSDSPIPFISLVSYSVLDLLVENVIFAKKEVQLAQEGYPNMIKLQANTIFTLMNAALNARIGVSNMKIYKKSVSGQNSPQIVSISEMQGFDSFVKEFKTYKKEDIELLNLKDGCKKMYLKNVQELIPFRIKSLISKILLIEKGANSVCKEIEKIQKENLIDMVDKINNESNPFMLLNYKLYMEVFVECQENIDPFKSENVDVKCVDNYFTMYEEKLFNRGFIIEKTP